MSNSSEFFHKPSAPLPFDPKDAGSTAADQLLAAQPAAPDSAAAAEDDDDTTWCLRKVPMEPCTADENCCIVKERAAKIIKPADSAAAPAASDAIAKIDKALQVVYDLCHGRQKWTMRVPAEPDRDPDLVIAGALRAARDLLAAQPPAQDGCRYPLCQSEAEQDRIAAQVHAELYGRELPPPELTTRLRRFADLVQSNDASGEMRRRVEMLTSAADTIDALAALASAGKPSGQDEKDAARYRWLRDHKYLDSFWSVQGPSDRGQNIDADIDECMKPEHAAAYAAIATREAAK